MLTLRFSPCDSPSTQQRDRHCLVGYRRSAHTFPPLAVRCRAPTSSSCLDSPFKDVLPFVVGNRVHCEAGRRVQSQACAKDESCERARRAEACGEAYRSEVSAGSLCSVPRPARTRNAHARPHTDVLTGASAFPPASRERGRASASPPLSLSAGGSRSIDTVCSNLGPGWVGVEEGGERLTRCARKTGRGGRRDSKEQVSAREVRLSNGQEKPVCAEGGVSDCAERSTD